MKAKSKAKEKTDLHQVIVDYLIQYAYIPEMRNDGSAFEKRKIKTAAFSADKRELIITGGVPDSLSYTLLLKDQRKLYARTDREYAKLIIRGFVSVGEDFARDDRQKLIVYLKGFPANAHVPQKIMKGLSALIADAKKAA